MPIVHDDIECVLVVNHIHFNAPSVSPDVAGAGETYVSHVGDAQRRQAFNGHGFARGA